MSLLFNDQDEHEEHTEEIQTSKIQDIWNQARKNDAHKTYQSEEQKLKTEVSIDSQMDEPESRARTDVVLPDMKALATVAHIEGIARREQKPLPPRKSAPPIPPRPVTSTSKPVRNQNNNNGVLASDINVKSYIEKEGAQARTKASLFSEEDEF